MSSYLRKILEEVKERLLSSGFSTYVGYHIDPDQVVLPVVSVQINPGQGLEGSGSDVAGFPGRTVRLDIEHFAYKTGTDPLFQFADVEEQLRRAIFEHDSDLPDSLGKLVNTIDLHRSRPVEDEIHSNVQITQVTLDFTYLEG